MPTRKTEPKYVQKGWVYPFLLQSQNLIPGIIDLAKRGTLLGDVHMGLSKIVPAEERVAIGNFVIDTDQEEVLLTRLARSTDGFAGATGKGAPVYQWKKNEKWLHGSNSG